MVIFLAVAVGFHILLRHTRYGKSPTRSAPTRWRLASPECGSTPSRRGVHDRWAPLGTWRGRHVGACRERPGGHGHVLRARCNRCCGDRRDEPVGRHRTNTGTAIGTIILGIMTSGFTFVGLDAYIQDIVKGGVIVSAVVADRYRHRFRPLRPEGAEMRLISRIARGPRVVDVYRVVWLRERSGPARQIVGVTMAHFDDNFLTMIRSAMVEHAAAFPDIELQLRMPREMSAGSSARFRISSPRMPRRSSSMPLTLRRRRV